MLNMPVPRCVVVRELVFVLKPSICLVCTCVFYVNTCLVTLED